MELNREELEALLGAYAIDALDQPERDEVDDLIAADAGLAAEARRYHEAATGLLAGSLDEQPAPAGLRDGLLERATEVRPPGGHLANPIGAGLDVREIWRRQWAELDELLDHLGPDDWYAVTSLGRTVRELLAHLTAVLDLFAVDLGDGTFVVPEGTPLGHWELTEPRIAELADQPVSTTVDLLRAIGTRLHARIEGFADEQLDELVQGGVLTVADRTRHQSFELWMHTDDVRRSTGRAMVAPDPERVCALSDLSARFLGFGLAVTGRERPGGRGRLVLTGPGGGTWLTPLGLDAANGGTDPTPGEPDRVVVIADAVDYCRMAGKLFTIEELAFDVEGDAALALDLFVAAQVFAE